MNTKYRRVTSRVEVPPSNLYYIWRGGEQYGPYMTQDVLAFHRNGDICAEDFIRESHSADWIDAASFLMPIVASEMTHQPEPEAEPVQEPQRPVVGIRRPLMARILGAATGAVALLLVGMAGWLVAGQPTVRPSGPLSVASEAVAPALPVVSDPEPPARAPTAAEIALAEEMLLRKQEESRQGLTWTGLGLPLAGVAREEANRSAFPAPEQLPPMPSPQNSIRD